MEDERGMDPKFIKASEEGNAEYLDIHVQRALSSYRTIVGDSVLHLHVREKGRTCDNRFMAAIIAKDPSLVYARNDAEENPFHTAAKSGQDGAVKFLIENGGASYMIMVNKDGDTALHIACREGNLDVVKELLVCRSVAAAEAEAEAETGVVVPADYKYGANNAGETPLHLAVEKNCHEIVHLLMEKISTSQHGLLP